MFPAATREGAGEEATYAPLVSSPESPAAQDVSVSMSSVAVLDCDDVMRDSEGGRALFNNYL